MARSRAALDALGKISDCLSTNMTGKSAAAQALAAKVVTAIGAIQEED